MWALEVLEKGVRSLNREAKVSTDQRCKASLVNREQRIEATEQSWGLRARDEPS